MTHDQLCDIAVRWLLRPLSAKGPGCNVAFKEAADPMATERCDAFGYGWWKGSVLVEAKVSRSDFLADRKKSFRIQPETGVGEFRYYICPEGLIQPGDLPPKWGLLWVNSRGHVKVMAGHVHVMLTTTGWRHEASLAEFQFTEWNRRREINLLAYMFRRVGDPDANLQRQRQDRRTISEQEKALATANKERMEALREAGRMRRQLERAGLTDDGPIIRSS